MTGGYISEHHIRSLFSWYLEVGWKREKNANAPLFPPAAEGTRWWECPSLPVHSLVKREMWASYTGNNCLIHDKNNQFQEHCSISYTITELLSKLESFSEVHKHSLCFLINNPHPSYSNSTINFALFVFECHRWGYISFLFFNFLFFLYQFRILWTRFIHQSNSCGTARAFPPL